MFHIFLGFCKFHNKIDMGVAWRYCGFWGTCSAKKYVTKMEIFGGFLPHKYIFLFDPFTNICTSLRNILLY